jgi:hypothetical protein
MSTLSTNLLESSLSLENVVKQVLAIGFFKSYFHTLKKCCKELRRISLLASFDGLRSSIQVFEGITERLRVKGRSV